MDLEIGDIVLIEDVGIGDSYYDVRHIIKHMVCRVDSSSIYNRERYWGLWVEPLFEHNFEGTDDIVNYQGKMCLFDVKLKKLC